MTDSRRDGCYAICPYCEYKHGDCWEWVKEDETKFTCNGCERKFVVYADVRVTYVTRKIRSEP